MLIGFPRCSVVNCLEFSGCDNTSKSFAVKRLFLKLAGESKCTGHGESNCERGIC